MRCFHRLGVRLRRRRPTGPSGCAGSSDAARRRGRDRHRDRGDRAGGQRQRRRGAPLHRPPAPAGGGTGAVILLLLHEKKPQEGARIKQTFATMGARAWIQQADTQLMLAKRGRSEEEELEDGGFRLESRFVLATGKLRDGGAEVVESLRITSGCVRTGRCSRPRSSTRARSSVDPKVAEMLEEIVGGAGRAAGADAERSTSPSGARRQDQGPDLRAGARRGSGQRSARAPEARHYATRRRAPMTDLSATFPPRFRHLAGFPRQPPYRGTGGGSFRQLPPGFRQPVAADRRGRLRRAPMRGPEPLPVAAPRTGSARFGKDAPRALPLHPAGRSRRTLLSVLGVAAVTTVDVDAWSPPWPLARPARRGSR